MTDPAGPELARLSGADAAGALRAIHLPGAAVAYHLAGGHVHRFGPYPLIIERVAATTMTPPTADVSYLPAELLDPELWPRLAACLAAKFPGHRLVCRLDIGTPVPPALGLTRFADYVVKTPSPADPPWTPPDVRVSAARADERDFVTDLLCRAFLAGMTYNGSAPENGRADVAAYVTGVLAGRSLVARLGDRLIGHVTWRVTPHPRTRAEQAEMVDLFVLYEYGGLGVGRALTEAMEADVARHAPGVPMLGQVVGPRRAALLDRLLTTGWRPAYTAWGRVPEAA